MSYRPIKTRVVFASLTAAADTTITTAGTYYPIVGTFTNNPIENFGAATTYTPGIKYTEKKTMNFEIDWHAAVQASVLGTSISIAIKVNNVLLSESVMTSYLRTAGEPQVLSGTVILELSLNDEIQLVVTSDGSGDVLTFNSFTTTIRSIIN